MRDILKQKKGTTTIEAAVMLPLILMVVVGYLFFLNAVKESMVLQQAAREGAIYYATYGNANYAVEKTKTELARGGIDPEVVTITPVVSETQKGIIVKKTTSVFTGEFVGIDLVRQTVLETLY